MKAINEFLKEVKKRRKAAGMSMELTASIVGCCKSYICEIENRNCSPNFRVALKLAQLFDISIDEINRGEHYDV